MVVVVVEVVEVAAVVVVVVVVAIMAVTRSERYRIVTHAPCSTSTACAEHWQNVQSSTMDDEPATSDASMIATMQSRHEQSPNHREQQQHHHDRRQNAVRFQNRHHLAPTMLHYNSDQRRKKLALECCVA